MKVEFLDWCAGFVPQHFLSKMRCSTTLNSHWFAHLGNTTFEKNVLSLEESTGKFSNFRAFCMPVLHIHFFGWLVGFFFWSNKCASYHLYSNTILKAFDQVTPCSYSLSHPLFSNVTEQQHYAIRYNTATFTAGWLVGWLLLFAFLLSLLSSEAEPRFETVTRWKAQEVSAAFESPNSGRATYSGVFLRCRLLHWRPTDQTQLHTGIIRESNNSGGKWVVWPYWGA